jgi:alpha-beta hydrolase superfamily lysophospholipase
MIAVLRLVSVMVLALSTILFAPWLHAAPTAAEIGVVVMHGKGGQPGRFVDKLASALEREGFQVANLEMPWSGRRHYDVDMNGGVDEITRALEAMRAKGVRKVFVAGHSQGGLFALHYGGLHPVDGLIPIAPGGQVDVNVFVAALGQHVARARQMVADGRADEKAEFGDFESSRGTNTLTTTAAIYLDWFDPNGAQTTRAYRHVKKGIPVLYVAPKRDYPGLIKGKQQNFGGLPSHPHTRMYEPDADHLNAPAAAAGEIALWIRQVSEQ